MIKNGDHRIFNLLKNLEDRSLWWLETKVKGNKSEIEIATWEIWLTWMHSLNNYFQTYDFISREVYNVN